MHDACLHVLVGRGALSYTEEPKNQEEISVLQTEEAQGITSLQIVRIYSLAMLSQHSIWLFVACSPSSWLPPLAPLSKCSMAQGSMVEYEVCLSPGCIADGAQSTLDQLFVLRGSKS
jgi:hypothetical protein